MPGGRRSGQPGMRGPVEVVHLEALSVDETPNDDPATRDELRAATDEDRRLGEGPDVDGPEAETSEADSGVVDDLVEKAERRRSETADHSELDSETSAGGDSRSWEESGPMGASGSAGKDRGRVRGGV